MVGSLNKAYKAEECLEKISLEEYNTPRSISFRTALMDFNISDRRTLIIAPFFKS